MSPTPHNPLAGHIPAPPPAPKPSPPPPADLAGAPTRDNIGEWCRADAHRRVWVIARDANVGARWANHRNVPSNKWSYVDRPGSLVGAFGETQVIVRLTGASGKPLAGKLREQVGICETHETWVITDALPSDQTPSEPGIGGATFTGGPIRPRQHSSEQGDVFHLVHAGLVIPVSRNQMPDLISIINDWLAARPYRDQSAENADSIRAAIRASKNPFAVPEE